QLGVDLRPSRSRVLELLEYDNCSRLTHDEAVSLGVEGTAGSLGIVIPAGERAHGREAGDPDPRHRRLGAAAEHDLGPAEPDRIETVPDRHVPRRAGLALGG